MLSANGQRQKCLRRQIEVSSDNPSDALVAAEREIDDPSAIGDRVEVASCHEGDILAMDAIAPVCALALDPPEPLIGTSVSGSRPLLNASRYPNA